MFKILGACHIAKLLVENGTIFPDQTGPNQEESRHSQFFYSFPEFPK